MKVLGDALIVERRGVNIVVPLLLFVEKGEVYMIIYLGRHLLVMVKLQEGKVIIEKGLYNDKNNFNNKTFFYRNEEEKSYSKTQRTKLDYPTNPWLLKAEEKKSMN